MTLKNIKGATVALWVCAVIAFGLVADVTASSWFILAVCAFVPSLVMMRYWNHPTATMSQSIQRELR